MLIDSGTGAASDIELAKERSHGLGLFVRSLIGLDREAAVEHSADILTAPSSPPTRPTSSTSSSMSLMANGVVEPARLYESPYICAPSGFRTPDPLIKSQLLYQLS
jgi:type I restriction enzyme, R subunit